MVPVRYFKLDNKSNATGFTVQRANNVSFATGLVTVPLGNVQRSHRQHETDVLLKGVRYQHGRRSHHHVQYRKCGAWDGLLSQVQDFNSEDPSAWVDATPIPVVTP